MLLFHVGKVIQNVNENSFDPLTLIVCLDNEGQGRRFFVLDKGEGWEFQKGDYKLFSFEAGTARRASFDFETGR